MESNKKNLPNRSNIVIRKALNTDCYVKEGMKQLHSFHYAKINKPTTEEIFLETKQLITCQM